MQTLNSLLATISPLDSEAMARAQKHIDGLLKPFGSLGRLESLAVQLAGMPGMKNGLNTQRKAILVMCADHGVYAEGVAISPKIVTAIQAMNMTRHNTGVCVLGATVGADIHVVDVGIDSDALPGVLDMKVGRGSGNIAQGPAMSREQAENLLLATMKLTMEKAAEGITLFGVGESRRL